MDFVLFAQMMKLIIKHGLGGVISIILKEEIQNVLNVQRIVLIVELILNQKISNALVVILVIQ